MGTLTDHDIQVRLIDFPTKGNETVTKNEDDTFTIFINAKLSHEMQLEAYVHALQHIHKGDFNKEDVNQIEYDAHGL